MFWKKNIPPTDIPNNTNGLQNCSISVNVAVAGEKAYIEFGYYIYIWAYELVRPGSQGTIRFPSISGAPAIRKISGNPTVTILGRSDTSNRTNQLLIFTRPFFTFDCEIGCNGLTTGDITFSFYYTLGFDK